jgi:8-oxo-dGTP pyrophosphatase MutT (NUDIX family)
VPDRSWKLVDSRAVADYRIFQLKLDKYRLETSGVEHNFVVLESPDWVNVVPVTSTGEVVLVRQYRHGVRSVCLEIPGGMIDPGETAQEGALRELREETGYVPQRISVLGRVTPNPAILSNRCYSFLAEGCRLAAEPKPDPLERIDVVLYPLEEVTDMIRNEEISNSMVINAFAFMGLSPRTARWTGPEGFTEE